MFIQNRLRGKRARLIRRTSRIMRQIMRAAAHDTRRRSAGARLRRLTVFEFVGEKSLADFEEENSNAAQEKEGGEKAAGDGEIVLFTQETEWIEERSDAEDGENEDVIDHLGFVFGRAIGGGAEDGAPETLIEEERGDDQHEGPCAPTPLETGSIASFDCSERAKHGGEGEAGAADDDCSEEWLFEERRFVLFHDFC